MSIYIRGTPCIGIITIKSIIKQNVLYGRWSQSHRRSDYDVNVYNYTYHLQRGREIGIGEKYFARRYSYILQCFTIHALARCNFNYFLEWVWNEKTHHSSLNSLVQINVVQLLFRLVNSIIMIIKTNGKHVFFFEFFSGLRNMAFQFGGLCNSQQYYDDNINRRTDIFYRSFLTFQRIPNTCNTTRLSMSRSACERRKTGFRTIASYRVLQVVRRRYDFLIVSIVDTRHVPALLSTSSAS